MIMCIKSVLICEIGEIMFACSQITQIYTDRTSTSYNDFKYSTRSAFSFRDKFSLL
jgi:hypothetical protein